jgi:hypothetical protein
MLGACRGDFPAAERALSEASALGTRAQALAPASVSYGRQRAMVDIERATLEWFRGDFARAAEIGESALALINAEIRAEPGDAGLKLNLMVVAGKTSYYMLLAGRARDAVAPNAAVRRAAAELRQASPDNQFAQVFATSAESLRHWLDAETGQRAAAADKQRALIRARAPSFQTGNMRAVSVGARLHHVLAEIQPHSERRAACEAMGRSIAMRQSILAGDSDNVQEMIELMRSGVVLAAWQRATPAACMASADALTAARRWASELESRGVAVRNLAAIRAGLGGTDGQLGDKAGS